MSAAPTNIYAYPYTAWSGRAIDPERHIGEIEAHSVDSARSRIRNLHRALFAKAPRRIVLGKPQFLRTTNDGGFRIGFYQNGLPKVPLLLVRTPRL